MKPRISPKSEPQALFWLALLSFLELFLSGVVSLFISPDPKNALIFGFSALRLLLVAGTWILAAIVLIGGVVARKKKFTLDSVWLVNQHKSIRRTAYGISFAFIIWGWLSAFCPAYSFHRQMYIFERIQPLSIAFGIAVAQAWLFFLFARGRLGFLKASKLAAKNYYRPILLFALIIIGLAIFMGLTKFGLPAKLIYSNVPGVPLTGLQLFFIVLLAGISIALTAHLKEDTGFIKIVKQYRLIPILIFITAILTWGLTPLQRHFFSLQPAAPGYQPYPYSDARFYDVGGISILRGYGIYFFRNYDKPLYMIFLAILHAIAGYDYGLMTWLQILVLAFIPVILFLLGKKFHSPAFGIFLALVLIIRQRNAIVVASDISSINPKLFMSEEMTLLGVILFVYLVFRWIKERKLWQALLCGGCLGATSLFRFNSLLFFPIAAILVAVVFWKLGKKFLLCHLSAYSLAFLIIFIPWIFSSVDPQGTPWIFLKFQQIIDQRYGSINPVVQGSTLARLSKLGIAAVRMEANAVSLFQASSLHVRANVAHTGNIFSQSNHNTFVKDINVTSGIVYRFFYHLLHNFSSSVMSIPDSFKYEDLNHLSQRIYWIDSSGWMGDLPAAQIGFIFLNLSLVAIGLGYSWAHHRWAGMIPMAIFAAYSFSLAAAMNSGGRYLTPIDWVVYFYYGIAIVVIVQFAHRVITGKDQNLPAGPGSAAIRPTSDKRTLAFSLAGIICLASLIPIANFVIPVVIPPSKNQSDAEAVKAAIVAEEKPGAVVVYGEIHYPFVADDMFTFDLLTRSGDTYYSISRTPDLEAALSDGEQVFITLRPGEKPRLQVESIYQWQGEAPVLIWRYQP